MINPKIAEEDIRITDEYIRELFDQIKDGRTAEQAVCMDYSAVFGKNSEEAFVFVQDILTAKKEYDLHKETAMRELPEQYLWQFITELLNNPDYTISQRYQILSMAKAYFLKISCLSLGDDILTAELGLSFETAMLAVEAEFSDRMRHATDATKEELATLYEEVLLASEAALVLPYPLEIAQTIADYMEENILTKEDKEMLNQKREMYLVYTYAVYKAVKQNVLTMKTPDLQDDLLNAVAVHVLTMSDLSSLVQDIRGGKTSLEKAQSVVKILVSVLFSTAVAGLAAVSVASVGMLVAETYFAFGAFAGTVTLAAVSGSFLMCADEIAEFAGFLLLNVKPSVTDACQIASKKIADFIISQKANLNRLNAECCFHNINARSEDDYASENSRFDKEERMDPEQGLSF